ncbi:MAG: PEP-CTERM sorting domain-containing protein [Planctomycetota bacterium]
MKYASRDGVVVWVAGVGIAAAGVTGSLQAADLDWNATGALLFYDTDTNWDPNSDPAGPTDADNLTFSIDLGGSPIVLGSPSNGLNLDFTDNAWTFTGAGGANLDTEGTTTIDDLLATALGNGASLTFTGGVDWDNALDVIAGEAGYGTLTYEGGGDARVQTVYVGRQAGSVGEFNVTGSGTLFQTDGTDQNFGYFVGEDGTGTLNVTGGATARIVNDTSGGIADFVFGRNATGNGTGNIGGVGTQIIAEDVLVGNSGTGALNITNGGTVLQNIGPSPDAFVGSLAGSSGSVVVNGDGSRWASSRTEIGNNGSGTLSVEAGGLVESGTTAVDDMVIGDQATATGSVAVFGSEGGNASRLTSTRDLYVGASGLGELRIGQDLTGSTAASGGFGELSVASDLRIGLNATNTFDNKAILDGANATATVGDVIYAGENGTGTLEVRNGATITGARLRVGSGVDSNGSLLVTGDSSLLTATTDLVVATNGIGDATVSDGGRIAASGEFWVGYSGSAVGTLTIDDATVNVGQGNSGNFYIGGRDDVTNAGGNGTVIVENGGLITSALDTIIGSNETSSGVLTVTGAGSIADFSDNGAGATINDLTTVGGRGGGILNVNAGGELAAEGLYLNSASANTQDVELNVDGMGTEINVDGALIVGNAGSATATISGGAQINTAFNPDTNVINRRVIIGLGTNSDGSSLTLTGNGTRLDYFDNERLSVGFNGGSTTNRALLEVLDGAVVQLAQPGEALADQGFIVVGDEANGNGQIDVRGAGSLLEGRYLNIGESTNTSGLVNITDGGEIRANDFSEVGAAGTGSSFMNISGSGSLFEVGTDDSANSVFQGDLSVGAGGVGTNGTLNIFDGGTARNVRTAYVGRFSGSNGTLNLGDQAVGDNGALATWEVGQDLHIAGTANLAVSGSQTSGSGTVNINENGLLDVTGQTVIKDRGTVTLNGGELATDTLLFQDFAERAGSPTLNFNSGKLRFTQAVGNTLSAALLDDIFGGPAQLNAGQHLAVDNTATFGDEIRVNGGELSVGSISTANFQNVDFDAGTLNLTSSGLVVTAAGLFGSVAVIDNDETLNVANTTFVQADGLLNVAGGSFSTSATVNSGTIVIAEGTADFGSSLNNTNGDLILVDAITTGLIDGGDVTIVNTSVASALALTSGSSITFGIETEAGSADQLQVAATASLAGSLSVTAQDVSSVGLGDEYDLITAGNVVGTFDAISLPSLGGGLGLEVLYEATRVALTVVDLGSLVGDYNANGFVSQADLNLLLLNWGDGVLPTGFDESAIPGGGPFDGLISQNELNGVLLNWGAGTPPTVTPIPEPTSAGLLVLLGSVLTTRRRRAA